MGHGAAGWSNPNYRQLVLNAIKWAASPESKAWAKANAKRIFKWIRRLRSNGCRYRTSWAAAGHGAA